MPNGFGLIDQSAYSKTSKRNPGFNLLDTMVHPPQEQFSEFSLIPANAKAYIAHLLGIAYAPKMSDLTSGDIDAIKRAVATARIQNGGASTGSFGYGQYKGQARTGASEFDTPSTGWQLALRSFTDPTFRAETLLGQARYKMDNQGNVVVNDTYNFNTPRSEMTGYLNSEGPLQITKDLFSLIRSGRTNEALETLINMRGPAKEEGAQYSLNLGKLR